jgi:hypothetical protein
MTLVRGTFNISSVANGEDAISYEIVPSTRSLLIDADGNWVVGTTISGRYAKVICSVYKVTGSKRELCTEKLWYSASNVIAKKGSFNGGSFHLMIPSSTNVVDVSIFASNETASGPTGSSLAIISIPVIHNGTNGTAGASLLCQYSADKTNWHDGFRAGDVWMRQKLSTDTTWSDPMRIVGEKGTDGSYTEYSYGISEKESVASSANSPGVENWYDMPIPTTKDKPYLWMRVIKVDEKGNESSPAYTRLNGKDGNNGTSVNIKGSKPSSSALPSSGQKMGDCYLINGELWVYTGETGSGIVHGFVNCGNIKGEPGDSAVQYFYHIAWATGIKTDSSGTMTGVEGFTTSNPAGLSYAYMGVCYNTVSSPDPSDWNQYKWVKVEGKDAVTYEIKLDSNTVSADGKTGKFLTTKLGKYRLLRHTGDKTENCSGVLDTLDFLIFPIGADGEALGVLSGDKDSDIYGIITGNGLKEENVYQIKFFWYSGPAAVANRYNYLQALKKTQGTPTSTMVISVLASNTFTVLRQGVDGERGSSGAVWRQHRGFVEASETATYKYEAGGNDEKFIDAVLLTGASGKKTWYRCIQSYYSTGKSDSRNTVGSNDFAKYWDSAYMTVDFIATDFFLSENAVINLLGSNEINLTDKNGDIFGSYRIPSGNGDDGVYALWLGAATGGGAPFSVTKSGEIYSVSGTIGGFRIGENGLGTSEGSNMFLMNEYIHFGNFAALTNFDGYCIELGRRNNRCLTAVSATSSNNDIYEGGFFSVLVNKPMKFLSSYAAALRLQCDWTADAGEIDMTKAFEGNHAILIESGDVAGIRPSFVRINKDLALSDYNFNVECYNEENKPITLTLPASPKWGQHYVVIQRGRGRINFRSALGTNIHDLLSDADGKTWYSGTRGQITWFWYDGTEWMVRYVNRQ